MPAVTRAAGAVDVKADVLLAVLAFQIQQLRDNQAGGRVVDLIRRA